MERPSSIQRKQDDVSIDHPHFNHTEDSPACDHCTYFKGIVYRVAVRESHSSNVAHDGPRSLESVALAEEIIEKREHVKYLRWSKAKFSIIGTAEVIKFRISKKARKKEPKSTTLTQWLQNSTKEDLLGFLIRWRTGEDGIKRLTHKCVDELREYILHHEDEEAEWHNATTWCGRENHQSIKPPQAAVRRHEELKRWYESKTDLELWSEVRERKLGRLPASRVDLIKILVKDDKCSLR